MSNKTKKPTGWNADEVLQEMRDHDHAEDWPSDVSTLTRWADVFAALIAERDALRDALGSLSAEADACVPLLRPNYDGHANFLAANIANATTILEKT